MKDKQEFIEALRISQDTAGHWHIGGNVIGHIVGDVYGHICNVYGHVGNVYGNVGNVGNVENVGKVIGTIKENQNEQDH